jgi:hypothetical protein
VRVGNIVKGKCVVSKYTRDYILLSGAASRDGLLAHKLGIHSKNAHRDTIELWRPQDVFGLIVKIDGDISGYGPRMAQVLLEKRPVWFFVSDLQLVQNPNKTS